MSSRVRLSGSIKLGEDTIMPSGKGGITTPIKTDLFHVVRVDHAKVDGEVPHFGPALPLCENTTQGNGSALFVVVVVAGCT